MSDDTHSFLGALCTHAHTHAMVVRHLTHVPDAVAEGASAGSVDGFLGVYLVIWSKHLH